MTLEARELSVPGRLERVTLPLRGGRVTAICGPNGAGKSTLLQALAGLLPPAAGTVLLDGEPLCALDPRRRAQAVGYLPQGAEIAWDVTVRSVVALGRMPHGDRADAPVAAALAAMDAAHLAERRVLTLSGGERARVLLARVLAGEPRWILADEPLAALDLAHRAALMRHLRAAAEGGAGVVVVLHDLAAAMNEADEVVVLDRGRLVVSGTPEAVLSPGLIARVWHHDAVWIGEAGHRALVGR
ncbi:ABC transporter ATP-binding protein [Erythrobacteraceae bacterium CFH 75059]|uniref:ABC transporter ATP-binding protein n=1 Tax=Qipengyuania thermophila TaxID=2509361 RepID=UPI0010215540|nr:ABC transporter ATP-binding protein [Qipengyuania thermophila]TCD05575.1 ABC transporter ATP-binding protein [Erythrobacteraceae bacterium CFH 75059]